MTERNRATTLRLRTPLQVQVPGSAAPAAPRAFAAGRPGFEPRRQQVHTFTRREDPTSTAILAELAALGLVEVDETEQR